MSLDFTIFADDLSGAAETAAAFLGRDVDLVLELDAAQSLPHGVTVIDLDSRTMPVPDADRVLRAALEAVEPGRTVMHKIDSLLRGHVGAAVDTLAERGPLIVAAGLPALGRRIRGGVLHVGDVPLHHTDLWHLETGAPPQSVADLISHPAAVCASPRDTLEAVAAGRVAICDITDDTDLDLIVSVAQSIPGVQLVGASALAAAVARTQLLVAAPCSTPAGSATVLTVVGTGAPSAPAQVEALLATGAAHVTVDADRLLAGTADVAAVTSALQQHRRVALTITGSAPAAQQRALSSAMGRFIAEVDRRSAQRPDLVLTGGETARAVIDALAISALHPVGVVHHGAVVSIAPDGRRIVTRPGSFGDRASLADITAHLASTPESASVTTHRRIPS